MKIGHILALGAVAYGVYQAYTHREDIKKGLEDLSVSKDIISENLDNIQNNLAIIQDQREHIAKMSQDLSYKTRVFQKDAQARLDVIQERLAKYQIEE